jgi:rsbT co-antagonist protein RsbR
MMPVAHSILSDAVVKYESEILSSWMDAQLEAATLRRDLMRDDELREQSRRFLRLFAHALGQSDALEVDTSAWSDVRGLLEQISRTRAVQGFSPSETATFVLSLKQPVFQVLRSELARDASALVDETWRATVLLDRLALFTTEVHQKSRDEVIARQQEEMLELSTPVVQLWEGVVALPLIGTLDSSRRS